MYCQECGTQIRSQAKFCNRCGAEVRQRFGEEHNQTVALTPLPMPMPIPPPPKLQPSPGPKPPAPHVPPPPERQPLSKHSWSRAEEAIIMPVIGKNPPENSGEKKSGEKKSSEKALPGSAPLPADTSERMKVRFDIMKPDTSDAEHVPNTGQINSAGDPVPAPSKTPAPAPQLPRQDPNLAPFFTQVVTTIPNRQHTRLILAVPLLLVVAVLLLVLAYVANK